jgi:hypothetical protein
MKFTASRSNARLQLRHCFSNLLDFLLDRQFIETRKRQAQQQANSAIENVEGITKGTFYALWRPFDGSRVGNAPIRGHWLTRPNRADFFGRVITNSNNEIHFWSARLGKFIPILTAQPLRGQVRVLQLSDLSASGRMNPDAWLPAL